MGLERLAVRIVRAFFDDQGVARPCLEKELAIADQMVKEYICVPLRNHQQEALASLLSDIAGGHSDPPGILQFVRTGRLVGHLNQSYFQLAAAEFEAVCLKHGKVDKRLLDKRLAEQQLFRGGILQIKHLS